MDSRGVAFGSTLDRELFPTKVPPNRMGNENRLKGDPHLAPGSYDNHEVSGFVYKIEKHVESKKGYTLGARTAPRLKPKKMLNTPGPGSYEHPPCIQVEEPGSSPFGVGSQRFTEDKEQALLPGPGTYDHDVTRHRKIELQGSFGGPQVLKWKSDVVEDASSSMQTRQSKLATDKEKRKQLSREAYLSLYWK